MQSETAIRKLTIDEIDEVSGGFSWFEGATGGGIIGTVTGAVITGTTAGATSYGVIGLALGFAAGIGWGIGTAIYDTMTRG